jgi:hypothetical protein
VSTTATPSGSSLPRIESGFGTQAAGQFLTDPEYLKKFARNLKSGWESKNLQLVIRRK